MQSPATDKSPRGRSVGWLRRCSSCVIIQEVTLAPLERERSAARGRRPSVRPSVLPPAVRPLASLLLCLCMKLPPPFLLLHSSPSLPLSLSCSLALKSQLPLFRYSRADMIHCLTDCHRHSCASGGDWYDHATAERELPVFPPSRRLLLLRAAVVADARQASRARD